MTTKEANKLDKLWRKAVLAYRGEFCQVCGARNCKLDCHHVFTRSSRSTRWDVENSCVLCAHCHTFSKDFSAHKTPDNFKGYLKRCRGTKWYEALEKKAMTPMKLKYEDVKNELEAIAKNPII